MRALKLLAVMLFSMALLTTMAACSSNSKKKSDDDLAQQQVEELYTKGKAALDKGNYNFAVDYYRALEANYPYGSYTEQAKLDMIFAYDKTGQSEKAIQAADNFVKLYPTHRNIDYAYYMKGVASFDKELSKVDRFVKGESKAVRDPKPLQNSEKAFNELIKRFPQSIYAKDAKQRIVYIRNELAKRELSVAQYYFEHETYVATVNRCKNIVYKYETTPSVESALVLMEKAYIEMGLNDLAASTHAVLIENFPEHQNKKPFQAKKKGFFKRLLSRD